MDNLELLINTDTPDIDPIVKMAVIHHQFESIQPFYDGNGRTGRINNISRHPYTKVQFLEHDLSGSRPTATRYLDALAEDGVLEKHRMGRENYYLNRALVDMLFNMPRMDVS